MEAFIVGVMVLFYGFLIGALVRFLLERKDR